MKFSETGLKGLMVAEPSVLRDNRGAFFRIFDTAMFQDSFGPFAVAQANRSLNTKRGTLRGMHFQKPPFADAKIIQCTHGAMLDVVTDIRKGSATFLQSFTVELTAANRKMLAIPGGFAHGFYVLEDDTEILYLHSCAYNKESEGALRYDDPMLHIHWPGPVEVISDRDKNHPYIDSHFEGI